MKLIRSSSKYIAIVNFDQIPYLDFLLSSNNQLITNLFNFENVGAQETGPQRPPKLVFSLGQIENSGRKIIIRQLDIEERKIVISLEGTSADAEKIYNQLVVFFRDWVKSTDEKYMEPVVGTYESEVIVQLDFDAESLLDEKFAAYVANDLPAPMANKYGKPRVKVEAISFRLDFDAIDENLKDYKISLSEKEFALAPRSGQPNEKRLFVSRAPVQTEAHVTILEKIESFMK